MVPFAVCSDGGSGGKTTCICFIKCEIRIKIDFNFCTGVIECRKSRTYPMGLTLDCLAFPDSMATARICVRTVNHGLSVDF